MAVTIRLENCAKTFPDGTRALEPTSIEIAAGETVASAAVMCPVAKTLA